MCLRSWAILHNSRVVLGIAERPEISATIWRTVADQKNKRYFFESTRSPNVFWVDLVDLDFTAGTPAKKLTLTDGAVFAGNTAAQFQPAEPLRFMEATVE
jgi:penicillin V acylase-like amidase (Ntn superfamily)